jgi:iron(III) transport system permease protein
VPAFARGLLIAVCFVVALPVLGVLSAWLALDAAGWQRLLDQAHTVLPGYVVQSLLLALGVATGVMVLGSVLALAVALFEFPGRRWLEWALLLPLAMPAYVLAYAWTDALQYGAPLQTALRQLLGTRQALWPDVRSLGGAVLLFVLCLYPYVYLLARTALAERAAGLMEAARLLGAPLHRRVWAVALPLARPAVVAGTALALMETLADYGVGAFFGLATFSTGIFKTWLVLGDRLAAAQLAAVLLLVVAALLATERRAQQRLRFATVKARGQEARLVPKKGHWRWALTLTCALPVLLGFVLPVAWLLHLLVQEARYADLGLPLARFVGWAGSSFKLAACAAALTTGLALLLAFAQRTQPGPVLRQAAALLSLGYAIPGAVVAVGLLLPLVWLNERWPDLGAGGWLTGSVLGLMLAYLARFSAVALQSVQSGYARIPLALDESARMLGSGASRVLKHVHLPLLKRSALVAALLVFVDVMKELPATLLLRPFGSDTLAVVAHNLARDERLAEAALPALAIVAVGLLPVLLLSRALRDHKD